MSSGRKIVYLKNLADATYHAYQAFYAAGIAQYLDVNPIGLKLQTKSMQCFPGNLPLVRKIVGSLVKNPERRKWIDAVSLHENSYTQHVGQYYVSDSHKTIQNFAIDAHDSKPVRSPHLANISKVYFKSNYWSNVDYPAVTVPIVNGNPLIVGQEETLRASRNVKKEYDVVFVSRIWGGREHNVRLFENVNKLDCKKYLYALMPGKSDVAYGERLTSAGVEWGFRNLPLEELWQLCRKARIVVLRAGKYMCIPWRMLDLLAMGSCILVDHNPYAQWPVPLREGENYVSLGLRREESTDAAPQEDYEKIPAVIEKLLADPKQMEEIGRNNGHYFDSHASPIAVGEYIIKTLKERNCL